MKTAAELLKLKAHQTVYTTTPTASVFDALKLMAEMNVGALLVMEGAGISGIITERDYARKVVLMSRSSKDTPVSDILSDKVICVSPDHTVEECMRLMTENRVRHLPVVQGDKILGIVSIGDLVNWTISAQHSTIHQLETYITGYPTSHA